MNDNDIANDNTPMFLNLSEEVNSLKWESERIKFTLDFTIQLNNLTEKQRSVFYDVAGYELTRITTMLINSNYPDKLQQIDAINDIVGHCAHRSFYARYGIGLQNLNGDNYTFINFVCWTIDAAPNSFIWVGSIFRCALGMAYIRWLK